jgi:hypothetical protein
MTPGWVWGVGQKHSEIPFFSVFNTFSYKELPKMFQINYFLGQKNFFFCPYVMASRTRTRCRQQLLQTSSSQKLLHLQT